MYKHFALGLHTTLRQFAPNKAVIKKCGELYHSNLDPQVDLMEDSVHLNEHGYSILKQYLIGVITHGARGRSGH